MSKKNCQSPEIKDIIARARLLSEKTASCTNTELNKSEPENAQSILESSTVTVKEDKAEMTDMSPAPATGIQQYVNFKGVLISEDGKLTKTRYLDRLKLSEEQYGNLRLTEEQAMRVANTMKHLSTGVNAAVPITCTGPGCPFSSSCPYEKEGVAPIGMDCIVETQLINYWTQQYLDEFNVDQDSLTEIHLVSELAEFNVYEMRITKYIATNHPDLMQSVLVGFSDRGDAIENTEISKAFDLKERIKRNRMRVLEALSATRKERLKLAVKEAVPSSLANTMADVKRKLDQFKHDIEKLNAIEGVVVTAATRSTTHS